MKVKELIEILEKLEKEKAIYTLVPSGSSSLGWDTGEPWVEDVDAYYLIG